MSRIRYKVADVETAGFAGPDAESSGVCEVAWIEIDEALQVIDRRHSLINPERPIEEGASAVHGLYERDVFGKPILPSYYLANWDDSPTVVIAHNKNFDLKFLAPHIPLLSGSICTLELSRQFLPGAPNHKLGTLADWLGLEKGDAHRAAGDVVTTLSLLRHLVAVTGRTLPQLVELGVKPKVLQTMPFGFHKGKAFSALPQSYLQWLINTPDIPQDVLLSAKQALLLL